MSTPRLNTLLDRSSSHDKDERYMATSDLCAELQKDIKIDATMERRICSAVLKQLDDQSNDVQSIAVKCLGVLLKRVHKVQVGEIADKLCSLILDGKDELRDIYSIGLKTLVKDMPEENASVCEKLTKRLLAGAKQSVKFDVKLEALDNLTDVLKRFGHSVKRDHADILKVVLDQLALEKPVARKRAAFCLAALASCCSEQLLEELFGNLLDRLGSGTVEETRTSIQTIGTIARAVGGKLGRRLDAIVPVFVKHVGTPQNANVSDEAQLDDMNELRDNCFQGLESFVLRCPAEIAPHLNSLIDVALQFSTYDPNYSYDDDDNDEDMQQNDEENDEENYEQDEENEFGDDYDDYDDDDEDEDDDSSWKVRRAAVKLLTAIIASRKELLNDLYKKAAPALVERFKEREENVRVDVIEAMTALLKATKSKEAMPSEDLDQLTPLLVDACSRQIVQDGFSKKKFLQKQKKAHEGDASKNEKSKAACYALLRALCEVKSLEAHSNIIAEAVRVGLSEKSQALRLDAARLLRAALDVRSSKSFDFSGGGGIASRDSLVEKVASLVKEEWYKLIAEGLRLVASLARLESGSALSQQHAEVLYAAATSKLAANDVDHEIKECAIEAAAALISHHGAESSFLSSALGLILDKARIEATRPAALKALADVAASSQDVSSITVDALRDLSDIGFQKHASRGLKQATLETLQNIIDNASTDHLDDSSKWALVCSVLDKASTLVCDDDLHLAHLAMKLSVSTIHSLEKVESSDEKAAEMATLRAAPAILNLLRSPLLAPGPALDALGDLLVALAARFPSDQGLSFGPLYKSVFDLADKNALSAGAASNSSSPMDLEDDDDEEESGLKKSRADKQMLANAASALAALCAEAQADQRIQKVEDLVNIVKAASSQKHAWGRVRLATLALGELGKRVDLASSPGAFEALMAASTAKTTGSHDDEDHRTSAALALGLVASGSVAAFLPALLTALEKAQANDDDEYVILAATKEVASAADPQALAPFVDRVCDRLVRSSDADGEPTRAMVADCLGALAPIAPQAVAKCLEGLLDRRSSSMKEVPSAGQKTDDEEEDVENSLSNPAVRANWTVAAALKQAGSTTNLKKTNEKHFLEHVGPCLRRALDLIDDAKLDLTVRRQALVMLNACAHHRPSLIAPLVSEALPKLRTVVDLKLERVVDLGPFKHKVDDGLPVRKAAIACVATFLDHALSNGHDIDDPDLMVTQEPNSEEVAAIFLKIAPDLVPICVVALADKSEDIQMVAHSLVMKFCHVVPQAIAQSAEPLLEALDKTVHKKISAKSGTEADRAYDLVRSGLKAALALNNLGIPATTPFLDKANKKETLANEIARLQANTLLAFDSAPTMQQSPVAPAPPK